MTPTKEQLQERAQLVRIHEANCAIEHPTAQELAFRMAIMKRIAAEYSLKELRATSIQPSSPGSATTAAASSRAATRQCRD